MKRNGWSLTLCAIGTGVASIGDGFVGQYHQWPWALLCAFGGMVVGIGWSLKR